MRSGASDPADWMFLGVRIKELTEPGDQPVVAEMWLPSGASPPLHVHDDLDDSFYLIEGRMVVRCGDEVTLAQDGAWVPFPAGVPHTFRVLGGTARALLVHKDYTFMRFVHAIGHPTRSGDDPTTEGGPSPDELSRVMAEHRMRNVGTPMEALEAQQWLDLLSASHPGVR